MSTTVAKLQAIVTAETRDAEGNLIRLSQQLEKTTAAADNTVGKFQGFEQVSGMLAGPLAAIGAAGAGAGIGLISLAGKMEQTQMAFTTLLKSGNEATRFLGELRAFADRTPFEFDGLTTAARRMMALGFSAQEVIPMLTDVGDAASGLGIGQEGIDRIVHALGRIQTAGKVTAESMMLLTENGVAGWKYLADAMGVSTAEVQKMVTQGLVPADQAIAAIRAGMQTDFGGMMAAQATTLNGRLSTLSDTAKGLAVDLGEQLLPAAKSVVDGLQGLASAVKNMDASQRISALTIGGTVTAIASIGSAAMIAGPWLVNLGGAISTMAGVAQGGALAMGALGGAVTLAIGSWAVAAGMIVDTANKVKAGFDSIDAALTQHEADMRQGADSYDEYINEMLRALEASGKLSAAQRTESQIFLNTAESFGLTNDELRGLVQTYDEYDAAQLESLVTAGKLSGEQADAITQYRAGVNEMDALVVRYGLASAAQFEMGQNTKTAAEQMNAYNEVLGSADDLLAGLQISAGQAAVALEAVKADPAPFTAVGDALGNLQAAFSGQVGQEIDNFTSKQAGLRDRLGEVQGKIDALQGKSYRTPAQQQELADLQTQLGELNGALATNATAHEDAMKRIAFSMLQAKLAADGWQAGELEMLSAVGVAWGVLDQQTSNMLNAVSTAMTAAGGDVDLFLSKMGGIYALPDKNINVTVQTRYTGGNPAAGENFGGWVPPTTTTTTTTPPELIVNGMRAAGGPVWPGGSFVVGENGPELFTPTAPGMITPGGASTSTWNGNIVINGAGDPQATARAVLRALKDRGLIPAVSLR